MRGFYIHLAQYLIVIAFLAVVNRITTPHFYWFLFAAGGWGIGVLFHGLRVFDQIPFLNVDWERKQVEKYLGRKL